MPPTPSKMIPPRANPNPQPKRKQGVLDRIKPIGFDEEEGLSVLLYGMSGSGKTTFAATFPKPILWILCSGGKHPGELRSIDTPEYRKTIKDVTLESSDEMKDLIEYQEHGQGKFQTIVLDHATGLQDLVLCEILGLDELPAQKSWGMASQQQYGQCTMQAKEYFRALLNLRCNRVIIAQERLNKTDGDSELIAPNVGAALMPSLAGWLNPACDYIVHTYKKQREVVSHNVIGTGKTAKRIEVRTPVKDAVDYCLRTGPDSVFTTKFRVPREVNLPHSITEPTYEKIMALIKGEKA